LPVMSLLLACPGNTLRLITRGRNSIASSTWQICVQTAL
jgi:hypothetical protein